MRTLILLAILMVSFSVFAVTPRIVDPLAGSQYEVEQDTVKEQITISVNTIVTERMHTVTGENTQSTSYDQIECYKPVYRVSTSAPVEVGWRF